MIIIFLLERLFQWEPEEPGTYWMVAGMEFIILEVPVLAYLISYIRWSLS